MKKGFFLNISNSSLINEVTIKSMQGQKVLNKKPNSQTANVDVSFLNTGIFIL